MDIRDLVLQNDNALPKLSTGTMSAEGGGTLPTFTVTSSQIAKTGGSILLSVLGMYYLAVGKREGDVEKLLIGGALSLIALFLF